MHTKFLPKWLQVAAAVIVLLTAFAASAARADGNIAGEIVSVGSEHTCALRPDGSVDCWGNNGLGQAEDQPGPYTQISAGNVHTCALTPSGAVDCWGNNGLGQAEDQPGPYTHVSAGGIHTCALTSAGAVECWGDNMYGQAGDHPGPYIQVSANFLHTCALTSAGAVECWGNNAFGQGSSQPGPYTQVSAGSLHSCALTPGGAVDCWGENSSFQAIDQPGPYIEAGTGYNHSCALTPGGAIECWGDNFHGQAENQPGPYIQFSTGTNHTCALTPAGAVACWGDNFYGQAGDHPGPYGPYNPNIDTTPPVVAVTGVTEGSTYTLGAVPQAGCSTSDEGSGVAVEASLTVSGGNELGVGAFTATCSGALDHAGNPGNTAVVHYSVAFQFTGFLSPVENLPVLNIAKAGQIIPLKWRLTDANGSPIANLSDVTVTANNLSCEAGTTGDAIEEYVSGGSGLQNLGDGYYQWNWKTPRDYANSCKTLSLDLAEGTGSEHIALFRFK
jgi:hypothetical protein